MHTEQIFFHIDPEGLTTTFLKEGSCLKNQAKYPCSLHLFKKGNYHKKSFTKSELFKIIKVRTPFWSFICL